MLQLNKYGFFLCLLVLVSGSAYASNQSTYTTNGSFTVPANSYLLFVEAWGGGAGGGSTNNNLNGGSSGGGGGAYAASYITVTPGQNFTVTVGTGGTGATVGNTPGNAGTASQFNDSTVYVLAAAGTTGANPFADVSIGGLASASTGQIRYSGGNGSAGGTSAPSGGGGAGAGSGGQGGNASGLTGGSGINSGGGNGANGFNTDNPGVNGNSPGGGASGGYCDSSCTGKVGGGGARGEVRVTSYSGNTFFIQIYNEITMALVTATNVTVTISSSDANYSQSTNTTSGTIVLENASSGTYTLTVSANGYSTRMYYAEVDNATASLQNLYILPIPYSAVTITVVDQTYQVLPNYFGSLNRKNLTTSTYYEVERCRLDSNGECIQAAILCTTNDTTCPYYRYYVYSPDGETLVGDSGDIRFDSFEKTIAVGLGLNDISLVFNSIGLSPVLASLNSSAGTTYILNNNAGLATSARLVVQRRVGGSYATLFDTSTTGNTTLTITYTGTDTSIGQEFIAKAYYTYNGQEIFADQKSYSPPDSGLGSNNSVVALFIGFVILFLPLLLIETNPILPPVISCVLAFFLTRIGLLSFTESALGGVVVIVAVVLWEAYR